MVEYCLPPTATDPRLIPRNPCTPTLVAMSSPPLPKSLFPDTTAFMFVCSMPRPSSRESVCKVQRFCLPASRGDLVECNDDHGRRTAWGGLHFHNVPGQP